MVSEGTKQGSLVVIGTGIRTVGQLTLEAIEWIKAADRVVYLIPDPFGEELVRQFSLNRCESLQRFYAEGKPRIDSYNEMVEHILSFVRRGLTTCAAFYGHPGVFVYPSHRAVERARAEGYPAMMLPGISAEDCLFADLGVDPATSGCHSYEATDLLFNHRTIDSSCSLILWQIGVLGNWTYSANGYDLSALPSLILRLLEHYPSNHLAYVYEAAVYPGYPPRVTACELANLMQVPLSSSSTLYVPPAILA